MFGLCMPEGEVYLLMKSGRRELVSMVDLTSPRKELLKDAYVLKAIKHYGYKKVEAIMYERSGYKVIIPMADYYAENGQKLEG